MGGKHSLAVGYPWLTVGAIIALEQYILQPDILRKETPEMRDARYPKRVLELGSGGSTIFWARNVPHVTSVETDPAWAPATLKALQDYGLSEKVELIATPHADALQRVAAMPDASFDLLLVDHADPTLRRGRIVNRLELAKVAVPKLGPNGWLCVDNRGMHGMEKFDYTDWDVWLFDDLRYSGGGTLIARRKSAFPLRVSRSPFPIGVGQSTSGGSR
jgi:hypothetical protein